MKLSFQGRGDESILCMSCLYLNRALFLPQREVGGYSSALQVGFSLGSLSFPFLGPGLFDEIKLQPFPLKIPAVSAPGKNFSCAIEVF